MDILLKLLPLPKEIVYTVASYDRVLSIKRFSKTDYRYKLLYSIPVKRTTFYQDNVIRGWIVKFSNPRHILSMVFQKDYGDMYTYINRDNDDKCEIYEWF
jgi:hypothetical protein